MLQDNTYEKLARANAAAIHGLQPKISVWNTGPTSSSPPSSSSASDGIIAPIRNLFQSLGPRGRTGEDRTGVSPPGWVAQMPPPPPASTSATAVNGNEKTLEL